MINQGYHGNEAAQNGTDESTVTRGDTQTGAWGLDVGAYKYNMTQQVPAQTRVAISGMNVKRVGALNQSALNASLAVGSVQLGASVTDANNVLTDPPTGTIQWWSRNSHVATVSSTGLVTFVGKGGCTIEARYSRQCCASVIGGTPSATEACSTYATLDLQIGH